MTDTTIDRIRRGLATHFGIDAREVRPTTVIADDLHADSLDEIEITMLLEDEFNLPIPDGAITGTNFTTVQDLADYIARCLPATQGTAA
ncbi:acyl carrier protein [Nitrospirillum viridazoti]|uniref:Acyl carrier protein n=1 Tax=Nitrospirillum viridazoti CBAmc TaxID=1441467 RepID=A0A248JS66_9PROT|nr:acyl carrier protein [Nitrospirillum amazonense]ASG21376.1 acyl carrier protein [Nitrospirillum amazonense CBAmc]TWB33052.1 acyl carrier protein [Nitrospirillum amazonense]